MWPPDVATIYLPCQGDVHGAMTAVPGPGHAQLVLSRGAILLTVTLQGQQNAHQKSRPIHTGQ